MVDRDAASKRLYPFTSRFMKVRGLFMHYVDEGKGEPVVMVHGNPTWSFYFRELITALSGSYRVIAPDHIGCGLSEKPRMDRYDFRLKSRVLDFTAFMDRLNLSDPVTLVVHDWGGMIAMAWAVRNAQKVGRVVVMNTAAFPPPEGKPIPLRLRIVRNLPAFSRPAVLGLNLFSLGARYMAVTQPLSREVRKGYALPYGTPRHRLATLKFVEDIPLTPADPGFSIVSDTARRLHRLWEKPMLMLWGGKDFVFDGDYFNEWRRRFPCAEHHFFPDAGHYVLEDRKGEICDRVLRFLRAYTVA